MCTAAALIIGDVAVVVMLLMVVVVVRGKSEVVRKLTGYIQVAYPLPLPVGT